MIGRSLPASQAKAQPGGSKGGNHCCGIKRPVLLRASASKNSAANSLVKIDGCDALLLDATFSPISCQQLLIRTTSGSGLSVQGAVCSQDRSTPLQVSYAHRRTVVCTVLNSDETRGTTASSAAEQHRKPQRTTQNENSDTHPPDQRECTAA